MKRAELKELKPGSKIWINSGFDLFSRVPVTCVTVVKVYARELLCCNKPNALTRRTIQNPPKKIDIYRLRGRSKCFYVPATHAHRTKLEACRAALKWEIGVKVRLIAALKQSLEEFEQIIQRMTRSRRAHKGILRSLRKQLEALQS